MNGSKRVIKLRSSPFFSIPLIGYGLLIAELLIVALNFSNVFYLPRKEKKLIPFFIHILESYSTSFIAKDIYPGHIYTLFSKKITLDLYSSDQLDIINEDMYQRVLWSLASATKASSPTKKWIVRKYGEKVAQMI